MATNETKQEVEIPTFFYGVLAFIAAQLMVIGWNLRSIAESLKAMAHR